MKPFAITAASLTRNGNLLLNHPQIGWVFAKADGTFCGYPSEEYDRNYGENEVDYLLRVCPQIEIKTPIWYKPAADSRTEKWKLIRTVRLSEDFSNYDPDRCCNGGSYGFWTTGFLFARTITDRRGRQNTEFGMVEQCRTTADFHYTDSGLFEEREWFTYTASDTETAFQHTESGYGDMETPLEGFPTFKSLTYKEVLEMCGTAVISDLVSRNIFISHIVREKLGRRTRRGFHGGNNRGLGKHPKYVG